LSRDDLRGPSEGHYHALTREFAASPRVQLRHMAATVADVLEDEAGAGAKAGAGANQKPAVAEKPITFLYKLKGGACLKSYGMQVSSLTVCS